MHTLRDIVRYIEGGDVFFLSTHINPEGDALGSSLALSLALDLLGKRSIVFDIDGVPEIYNFLPQKERVITSLDGIETSEMSLVLLDCNEPQRAGVEGISFRRTAVIDHHIVEGDGFGDIRWIEPDAPACGLMVYSLLKALGVRMTPEIALNLYTAIAIDTGTFRYGNTTAESLEAAAELVRAGALPSFVAENLYETWSEARFRLLCKALSTIEISGGIATMVVTSEMFKETGASPEDTENFAGMPRMSKSVRLSALFRQMGKDSWKVSLRSKGDIDVSSVARSFGGGGHRNASGYKIESDLETAKRLLFERLKALLPSQ